MPTLKLTALESFAAKLLQAGGASADEGKLIAASLVEKRGSRFGALFERRLKHALDAIPVAGGVRHTCFPTGPVVIRR